MPIYTYICARCNEAFEVFKHRNLAENPEVCPKCNCEATRDWAADSVYVKMPVQTLGALADKNDDKLSQQEKDHILNKTRRRNET